DVLIVGPVVEHDHQHGYAVMRGGPQRAGRIEKVTVVLDADADLARSPEPQGHAHRRTHSGPGSTAAGAAPSPAVHVPESAFPAAERSVRQAPVLTANGLPDLGRQPGRRGRLLRPPAFLQVLLGTSGDGRMNLPRPGGSLGDTPLQIVVH